jgi:hypothetical protein
MSLFSSADAADPAKSSGPADTGAVTAELAVVMPAVTAVLAVVLCAGQAVLAKVTCVDAARAGARAAARGDGWDQVHQLATQAAGGPSTVAGSDTTIDVAASGDLVTVTVSRSVRLVGLGPAVTVTAQALAQREGPATS